MNILSIQSSVAYGHVGNGAAVFPLQRLGAEVWAIDTVQFSNHPGYGDWTGRVAAGAEIGALLEGLARRGAFERCDAVLSGYLGAAENGEAVLGAVARLRRANAAGLYCCDPVIGDNGRVYVGAGIEELLTGHAVPEADVLTPNQFELERLTGAPCRDPAEVRAALRTLRDRMRAGGPRAVLLTSLRTDATPDAALDIVAADAHGIHAVRVERLPVAASGAGDATAALFLLHFLRTGRAAAAMEAAASAMQGVLRRTLAAGARDLTLVEAQEEFVRPSVRMQAEVY